MRTKASLASAALILALTGCNSARTVVPEPSQITLQDALVGTVQALNAAYKEARKPGNEVMGYYPCTVTANYNISASGTTTNKVGMGGSGGPPGTGIAISANASNENVLTGTRGNTVQLVLASSLCLPGNAAEAAPSTKSASSGKGPGKGDAASKGGRSGPPDMTKTLGLPPPILFDKPKESLLE